MALSVDTGQIAAETADATTALAVTEQGKAIILWTTGQTSNGSDSAANASWSIGFSDGTNHRCIGWASDDNVGTTNCGKALRTDSAVEIFSNGTPTSLRRVTGVAFTSSTVTTLTWDGTPASAYLVCYMQLGGSDITNVLVGTHTMANSTGDKTETGVGFEGDFGMFLFSAQTAAGTTTRANASIGFACKVNDSGTSRARQFGMCWGIDDGATMTATIDAVSYTNSSNFLSYITDGAETIDVLAQFGTSTVPLGFASDGFRYNISNASSTNAQLLPYLIIKGGQWDVGTTTHASARTLSGMAFQPKGIAFSFGRTTTDATVTVDQQVGFGAAASTTSEAVGMAGQFDATLNTDVERYSNTNNLYWRLGGSNTWVLDSFNSDGATLSGAGSSGNQVGWFTLGNNANTTTSQTQLGRARIQKTQSATQQGKAAIRDTTTRTQPGQSRIKTTASKTQPGQSRIQVSSPQTQPGQARIQATTARTQTGKAAIRATTSRTQTGQSTIKITNSSNQLGKASIRATTSRTQTGKAAIRTTTSKTQLGQSRIQDTASATQAGRARIQTTTPQTQAGRARIQATSAQTQAGRARMQTTSPATQQGQSRIQTQATRTQTGKAAIRATTSRTQLGLSKIISGVPTQQTQQGIARIQATQSDTQQGQARIQTTESATQNGRARITVVATRNQQGQSRVEVITPRTITGVSNIRATTSRTQLGMARIVPAGPGGVVSESKVILGKTFELDDHLSVGGSFG